MSKNVSKKFYESSSHDLLRFTKVYVRMGYTGELLLKDLFNGDFDEVSRDNFESLESRLRGFNEEIDNILDDYRYYHDF